MKVYINSKYEIKDVETTEDLTLLPVEVPNMFFNGWSVAKICCYKLIISGGVVEGFTPYVDSRIIEHIDKLAKKSEEVSEENMLISETIDILLTDIIPSLLG